MATEPPAAGSVLDYPYLWRRESDAGETEGRKVRPTCLVVSVATREGEHVNADVLERSWYYAPGSIRGAFSQAFLARILKAFRPGLARRGAGVDRQG
jgi:hypothetical protein